MSAARLRRAAPALLAGALAALAACLLLPSPALAFDPDSWLNDLIEKLIEPRVDDINSMIASLSGANGSGDLANPLRALFGEEVGDRVYNVAYTVMNVIMKPMAGTVLAFCLVAQLIKVSQHANSSSTFPGMLEVGGILVFFAIFSVLIGNAEGLVLMLYDVGRIVLNVVNQTAGIVAGADQSTGAIKWESVQGMLTDPGVSISIWVQFLIVEVALLVAQVVVDFSVWGRAIQIYVMMMLSPVPLALLGSDETKHMGIGFLKNLAALCLAAAIMAFVLWLFSIMFSASVAEVVNNAGQMSILAIGKLLALCGLLCMGLAKSGQWARDVLGG